MNEKECKQVCINLVHPNTLRCCFPFRSSKVSSLLFDCCLRLRPSDFVRSPRSGRWAPCFPRFAKGTRSGCGSFPVLTPWSLTRCHWNSSLPVVSSGPLPCIFPSVGGTLCVGALAPILFPFCRDRVRPFRPRGPRGPRLLRTSFRLRKRVCRRCTSAFRFC